MQDRKSMEMQDSNIKIRQNTLDFTEEFYKKIHDCKRKINSNSKFNYKLPSEFNEASTLKKNLCSEVEQLTKENNRLKDVLDDLFTLSSKYPELHEVMKSKVGDILAEKRQNHSSEVDSRSSGGCDKTTEFTDAVTPCERKKITADDFLFESVVVDDTKSFESLTLEACAKAQETMNRVSSILKNQKEQLANLVPELISKQNESRNSVVFNPVDPSWNSGVEVDSARLSSGPGQELNVLVEEIEEGGRVDSNYKWDKIELAETGSRNCPSTRTRPETRTVSTSPPVSSSLFDRTEGETDDRTCPMCHAIFPQSLPLDDFETHVIGHFEQDSDMDTLT